MPIFQQGFRVRVGSEPYRGESLPFYLFDFDAMGRQRIVPLGEPQAFDRGSYVAPAFDLLRDSAQDLMDDLWAAGIRPSGTLQGDGEPSAQRQHLADMRAIAFAKLNIAPPV